MSHEVHDHKNGKVIIVEFWSRRGFQAFCEAGCDVLAWRIREGRLEFVFCEYERSLRNLLRNCERNQSQTVMGTAKYLVVVPNERLRAAVRRQLQRHFPPATARKFAVTLLSRIERDLANP